MKNKEITSTSVKAGYMSRFAEDLKVRYDGRIKYNAPLTIELNLHQLMKVNDLYHNQTTFTRTLRKGESTASPYHDSQVVLKVKLEIDGQVVFEHEDPLSTKGEPHNIAKQACYDLE